MQKGNLFTFSFALVICLFCSVALAIAASNLKADQDLSARLYQVKNVLSVVGKDPAEIARVEKENPAALIEEFNAKFEPVIIDKNNNRVELATLKKELEEKLKYKASDLDQRTAFEIADIFRKKLSLLAKKSGQTKKEYDPDYKLLFLYKPADAVEAYIVPVEGNGLWDVIKGYVALEPDLNTIKDIRFYEQKETPGLGGECDKAWFTDMFKGKKILDADGNFVSITVAKGKVKDVVSDQAKQVHYVDGISGGTITSQGITALMFNSLQKYNSYFASLRSGEAGATTAAVDQAAANPATPAQSEATP